MPFHLNKIGKIQFRLHSIRRPKCESQYLFKETLTLSEAGNMPLKFCLNSANRFSSEFTVLKIQVVFFLRFCFNFLLGKHLLHKHVVVPPFYVFSCYRPQTKLREGNAFTGFCLSVMLPGGGVGNITCIMG